MVDFDFKFEEKPLGSTMNTSTKEFATKQMSLDKAGGMKIKIDPSDSASEDCVQSSELEIKTTTASKSKIDSNLFLIRRA